MGRPNRNMIRYNVHLSKDDVAQLEAIASDMGISVADLIRKGVAVAIKRGAKLQAKGGKTMAMNYEQLDQFQRIFEKQIDCDDTAERDRAVASIGVDGYLAECEAHAPEPWPAGFRAWAKRELQQATKHVEQPVHWQMYDDGTVMCGTAVDGSTVITEETEGITCAKCRDIYERYDPKDLAADRGE